MRNLPDMTVRIGEKGMISAPERVLRLLKDCRARIFCFGYHAIDFRLVHSVISKRYAAVARPDAAYACVLLDLAPPKRLLTSGPACMNVTLSWLVDDGLNPSFT